MPASAQRCELPGFWKIWKNNASFWWLFYYLLHILLTKDKSLQAQPYCVNLWSMLKSNMILGTVTTSLVGTATALSLVKLFIVYVRKTNYDCILLYSSLLNPDNSLSLKIRKNYFIRWVETAGFWAFTLELFFQTVLDGSSMAGDYRNCFFCC